MFRAGGVPYSVALACHFLVSGHRRSLGPAAAGQAAAGFERGASPLRLPAHRRAFTPGRMAVGKRHIQRLRRADGLRVPPTKRKLVRRGISTGLPTKATHRGHVWTWDFISDATVRGGALKMLTILDEHTRECHVLRPERALRAADVLAWLERAIEEHGAPAFLRSDNGPEFIAKEVQRWLAEQPDQDDLHRSGQPLAERLRGELPRTLPRRVPQPGATLDAHRGAGRRRRLPPALQPLSPARQARLPQPGALCGAEPTSLLPSSKLDKTTQPNYKQTSPRTNSPVARKGGSRQ